MNLNNLISSFFSIFNSIYESWMDCGFSSCKNHASASIIIFCINYFIYFKIGSLFVMKSLISLYAEFTMIITCEPNFNVSSFHFLPY